MMRTRKTTIVAVLAAVLVMLAGAGYAFAQTSESAAGDATAGQGNADGQGRTLRGELRKHMMAGEVIKVEGTTITIKTLKGEEKSVNVDDQTRYRKDGNDATLADVKTGEKVAVVGGKKPEEGQVPVAKAVLIGKPGNEGPGGPGGPLGGKKPVVGEVTALSGDTVTIKTAEGDVQVKMPVISNGMRIAVVQGDDGTARIVMYDPPERPQGDQGPPPDAGGPEDAEGDNA